MHACLFLLSRLIAVHANQETFWSSIVNTCSCCFFGKRVVFDVSSLSLGVSGAIRKWDRRGFIDEAPEDINGANKASATVQPRAFKERIA